MPLIATEGAVASSRLRFRLYLVQGSLGLVALVGCTLARPGEVGAVLDSLGPAAPWLVCLLVAFAAVLSWLKFRLTEEVFVSLAVVAYMATFPLLGLVLSAWIAVLVAGVSRWLGLRRVGSVVPGSGTVFEAARIYGLFGTYGLPVVGAALCYELLGGEVPLEHPSALAAARIAGGFVVFMAGNVLVMTQIQAALGYSMRTRVRLSLIDSGIYLVALPYSILVAFSWATMRFLGLLPALITGAVATFVVRNLAEARSANQDLVRRLSSLSNIGTAISIESTQQRLLETIHEECRKAIDVSMFTIALLDEGKGELSFDFEIYEGERRAPARVPLGEGLNSWVVENRRPLLLSSVEQERRQGLSSLDDDVPSESWLGVPMIVHDRVIGVISVQSLRKNAFGEEDVVLLRAVASQAAAAIEDARLYQAMEHLADQLEHRVAERTRDLREMNLQLAAADQAKTRFLATMSHELRTPLNSIIGFSRILVDRTRGQVSERMFGFINNILDSGTHLLALINELLDLSKIEAGRVTMVIEPFDIHEAVERVEQISRGLAADEAVSIESRVDPDLGRVWMDEGRLRQILFNLLSNAIKFSPAHGVVRFEVSRLGAPESPLGCETVRVSVRDEGPGIPADEMPKIFESFYQGAAEARVRRGTGLGLPLTLRLVELHRGLIDVASEPGAGSTFLVYLPVRAQDAKPRVALGPILQAAGLGRA